MSLVGPFSRLWPWLICRSFHDSRPDLIDPALLRPGRLDKSLLCDMPSHNDRLEVGSARDSLAPSQTDVPSQIMEACSRKISLSPSIDLSAYAAKTEGFSGADLQALVYNAHLDAIHETLSATESAAAEGAEEKGSREEQDVTYTAFGGTEVQAGKVLSRAEQASVNKRVSGPSASDAALSGLTVALPTARAYPQRHDRSQVEQD